MGIIPQLRAAATGSSGITFVNGAGRRVGRINLQAIRRATASRSIELGRADLASVLYRAVRDDADIRFGDAIASLAEDRRGVDVSFDGGDRERFDLVVGADGLHSNVGRLAFGPSRNSSRTLGSTSRQPPFPAPAASAVTWSCTTLRVGWPPFRRLAKAKWPSSYSGVPR